MITTPTTQHAADGAAGANRAAPSPPPLVEPAVERLGAGALAPLDPGGSSLGHWRGRIAGGSRSRAVAPDLLVARIVQPRRRCARRLRSREVP